MVIFTADLGANWRGDCKVLERMIKNCAQVGVDFVKFQTLSKNLIDRHPELKYYKKCSLTPLNINLINRLCQKYGISYYTTITDISQIAFLKWKFNTVKIRCADSRNKELIDATINSFDHVFISSTNPLEIKAPNIHNLYCIPKYPTELGEINFDMISRFEGYSNHCKNPLSILKAIDMGAKYIEFHLTDSQDEFALDNKVSFTYEEMKVLIKWAKLR